MMNRDRTPAHTGRGQLHRAVRLPSGERPSSAPSSSVTAPLDVLVVEDDNVPRQALHDAVVALGHQCRVARDGAEALAMHEHAPAQVIISDWRMPNMDGVELCRRVRTLPGAPYTYFLFLTSLDDKDHFIRGMEAGADDYYAKPVDIDELKVRLQAAHRMLAVYSQLSEQNAALRRDSQASFLAARLDTLTEIPNRLRLKEDLESVHARATRYGHRFCAALCDVDDFKLYNDGFGHLAGDDLLRTIALTLKQSIRHGDSIYRYGGEEFLILLPEQTLEEAHVAMERTRAGIEALGMPQAPRAKSPGPRLVTISIGIAALGKSETVEEWLARADAALYRAKAHGKNRVEA